MSSDCTAGQTPDVYGQVHPNETPELIQEKMKEFEIEVEKIKEKEALEQAKEKCPEQLDNEFKLMFLRSEVFNTDLAAKRYVAYWKRRLEIFGPDRAFLPLTQNGAFRDDEIALNRGYIRIVQGAKDPLGRGVLILDPSRLDKTKYARESMARSTWYVMHSLLKENVNTQKRGLLIIAYPKNSRPSQFDRELMKLNAGSIKGCLPVRLSAVHICHPPTFFKLLFPILKIFLGERLQKRILVHAGSEENIRNNLGKYGLTKDQLPTELGGNISIDHEKFLKDQRNREEQD